MNKKNKILALYFMLVSSFAFSDTYIFKIDASNIVAKNKSCKTLLDYDSSLISGEYNLVSGRFYCDMDTDSGGWTKVYSKYYHTGTEDYPLKGDMSSAVNSFKDFGASTMMIDLENRWFVMEGITYDEFYWMWELGGIAESRNVASYVRTSIGKNYDGKDIFWKHWVSELHELGLGAGAWDKNTIFDLGISSGHGPAFWDNANGIYKSKGGYQTPTSLTMSIYIK